KKCVQAARALACKSCMAQLVGRLRGEDELQSGVRRVADDSGSSRQNRTAWPRRKALPPVHSFALGFEGGQGPRWRERPLGSITHRASLGHLEGGHSALCGAFNS